MAADEPEAMEQEQANGVKEEPEDEQAPVEGGPEPEGEYQVMDAIDDSEAPEADQKTEGMIPSVMYYHWVMLYHVKPLTSFVTKLVVFDFQLRRKRMRKSAEVAREGTRDQGQGNKTETGTIGKSEISIVSVLFV